MHDFRDVFMRSDPAVEPEDSASHALVVGINEYADDAIRNLQFARSDAEALRDVLDDPEFGRFENVTTMLDGEATRERIIEAITVDLPGRIQPDDRVIIFFAGHGAPWRRTNAYSDGFEKYLLPANARLSSLPATAISMQDLQRHLQHIVARRLVIFLDACYSGATSDAGGTRGMVDPTIGFRSTAMTDEYLDQISGEGRVVITACGASEVAIELPDIGHGLFTKHIIDGLRGAADVSPSEPSGVIDLDSLYSYVYDAVRRESIRRRSPMNPIRRGDSRGRIVLARYTTQARRDALVLSAKASRAASDGQLYDAVELWNNVVDLDATDHAKAELERARGKLADARRLLVQLEMEGHLPEVQYTRASRLLNKRDAEHDATDRIIARHLRRLLDPQSDFDCADYLLAVEGATAAGAFDHMLERRKSGDSPGTHTPTIEATPTPPETAEREGASVGLAAANEEQEHLVISTLLSGLELGLQPFARRTKGKVKWVASVTNRNTSRIEELTLRLDRTRLATIALKPDETRTFERTSRYKKAGRRTKKLEAILETVSGLTLATSVVGEVHVSDATHDAHPRTAATRQTVPSSQPGSHGAEGAQDAAQEVGFHRRLSWWAVVVALVSGSIGSALLALWIVRIALSPFNLITPASNDWFVLLIAGAIWGLTYVAVGTSQADEVSECLFAPLIGYFDAFDGVGEFFRGILSALPINFVLSWGLANACATFGARLLDVSPQTASYAVYSIFGVMMLSGVASFLNEELL